MIWLLLGVNFKVLFNRLFSIFLILFVLSMMRVFFLGRWVCRWMCFCFVMFLNVVVVSVVIWVRLCCLSCLGIVLFLSFERLSIWLVRLSRCLFCCCILARVLVFVFCCLVFIFCSGLSSRVSGVWNLWLMFVKKLDFSLFSFCRWLVFVCWNLSFSVVCWVFFCCCLC